jgi:hypothetical protein
VIEIETKLKVKLTRAGDVLLWDVIGEPVGMNYNREEMTFEPTFEEFMSIFKTHICKDGKYFEKITIAPYEKLKSVPLTYENVEKNEIGLFNIFLDYTDKIDVKRYPLWSEFFLHFDPSSAYCMDTDLGCTDFAKTDYRLKVAIDELSQRTDIDEIADVKTYSVEYIRNETVRVTRWTKEQRAKYETILDLMGVSYI